MADPLHFFLPPAASRIPIDREMELTAEESQLVGRIKHVADPANYDKGISSISSCVKNLTKALTEAEATVSLSSTAPTVSLVLSTEGGKGDIAFVYKAALGLIERGCKVHICLMDGQNIMADEAKQELFQMSHRYTPGKPAESTLKEMIRDQKLTIATFKEDTAHLTDTDYVIIAPTKPDYGGVLSLFPELRGIAHDYVREYGCPNEAVFGEGKFSFSKVAGFGPDELGIFVDEGLKPALTTEQRVEALSLIQAQRPEQMALLLGDLSPSRYLSEKKLYFGYAHESHILRSFVSCIAGSEAEGVHDVDIAIPWRIVDGDWNAYKNICRTDLIDTDLIRRSGFTKMEIIARDNTVTIPLLEKDSSGGGDIGAPAAGGDVEEERGKTLRVVNVFPLSNQFFLDLMYLSEDLVLVTGDQSLNEAMLMEDKILLYENMKWKIGVHKQLMHAAGECNPALHKVMDSWQRDKTRGAFFENIKILREECAQQKSIGKKTAVAEFHEGFVNKAHDLSLQLYLQAKKVMALKDPHLQKVTEKIEQRMEKTFHMLVKIQKMKSDLIDALIHALTTGRVKYSSFLIDEKGWFDSQEGGLLPDTIKVPMLEALALLENIEGGESVGRMEIQAIGQKVAACTKGLSGSLQEALKAFQESL